MANTKAQEALRIAREHAKKAKCDIDFHNAFFGNGATLSQLFPTRAEREAFAKTPEFQEIEKLQAALPKWARAAC